jgi:hypothetical protein
VRERSGEFETAHVGDGCERSRVNEDPLPDQNPLSAIIQTNFKRLGRRKASRSDG